MGRTYDAMSGDGAVMADTLKQSLLISAGLAVVLRVRADGKTECGCCGVVCRKGQQSSK
jgi:hypothetical protein